MRLNSIAALTTLLLLSMPALAQQPRSEVELGLEKLRDAVTAEMAQASQDLEKAMAFSPDLSEPDLAKKESAIAANFKATLEARARLESKKDAQTLINTLLMNEIARKSPLTFPPERPTSQRVPQSADQAIRAYTRAAEIARTAGRLPDELSFVEKARVYAVAGNPASAPSPSTALKSDLQIQLQAARDAITQEEANASAGVTEATKTLLRNGLSGTPKGSDVEAEAEARANFESKLKANKTVDSLLVNLLARKNAWSFGPVEERMDTHLATLMKDLGADKNRTFARQASILKAQVDDVLSSQRMVARSMLRVFYPIWEKAQSATDKEKDRVNRVMQGLANEFYRKELAYKRGVEEARLYEALSGFDPTGGRLSTSGETLAAAATSAGQAGEKK